MKISLLFSACCALLALSFTAHAEIYESRDAQGNPVFTDTPTDGAEKVDLPQENIVDSVEVPLPSDPAETTDTPSPSTTPAETSNVTVVPNARNEELKRGIAADMPYEVGDIPSDEEIERREEARDGEYIDENGNTVRFEHRGHVDGRR